MPKMNKPGEYSSLKISKGVFASLVTISNVKDLSNHPKFPKAEPMLRNDGTPVEICVEVEYESDGGETWSQRFYGGYLTDKITGRVKGWKTMGKDSGVYNFFATMLTHEGLENLIGDDFEITTTMIKSVIGKQYYRVAYIGGLKDGNKGKYKDWNQIFPVETTIEDIQKAWANAAPYMTTYKPDVIDEIERAKEQQDTSFNPEEFQSEDTEEFEL